MYDMQVCHYMQVYYAMKCKFIKLCYASLICKLSYDMQVVYASLG